MVDWDTLLKLLDRRWSMPREEVCEQLIATIRYAVLTPLDFVQSAAEMLKESGGSSQVQEWARRCSEANRARLDGYWRLQEHCLSSSTDAEIACKCLVKGLAPLLADGGDLIQEMPALGVTERSLAGGDMARIAKQLVKKLTSVAQMCEEVQSQDLSWLLRYIDEEDKLCRRAHTD